MVREISAFGIDTKTAKVIVLAVIAWYDELRRVRLQVSRQGRKVGRPRKMTPKMADRARALRAQGLSYRAIGERMGVRPHTVWYELQPPERRLVIMRKIRRNVNRWRAEREVPL
jgi:hypothetical protein